MAEPIRSDALAALLKALLGGEGSGYSLPMGNDRGLTVLSQNAGPDVAEHERMHLGAGFNKQRNQTIDAMWAPSQARPQLPRGGGPTARPSPDKASAMMNQDDEKRLRALALAALTQAMGNR